MNTQELVIKKTIKAKRPNAYKILAFLLGVLVTNNIIYMFKISGTIINISIIFSILTLSFIIVFKNKGFKRTLKMFNIPFFIYILVAIFSFINVVIIFSGSGSMINRYINGIIYLILNTMPYILTLVLYEQKKYVLKGLSFGFVINLIVSLYSFINFSIGGVFTLYDWFPQDSFFIPRYSFRSQGLFLEPSYYLAFIISTFLIVFISNKGGFSKLLGIMLTFFIVIISHSKNTPTIILLLILFVILRNNLLKERKYKIRLLELIKMLFFLFVIMIFGLVFWNKILEVNLFDKLLGSFTNLFSLSTSDSRIFNMQQSILLIPQYLFGVGYNMSHSLLQSIYGDALNVHSTFNFLITNQLELGLLGTLIYLIMIKQLSWDLIYKGKTIYSLALGLSVLGAFITQIGNGIRLYPFILVIFGLATIEHFNIKKGLCKKSISIEENM